MPAISAAHSKYYQTAVVLAMTMALAPLALDTYLPAFPAMAESLDVQVHDISLSIAVYVFMLALGQLVAGPLSDHFGRPIVMLTGLLVFSVASFFLSQVQAIESLLAWRGVQAFGGGWAMVCVPALVRDRFSGKDAARFFSLIGLITIIAPAIAPSFGSALLLMWGWPSIFIFLSGYSLLMAGFLRWLVFNAQRSSEGVATSSVMSVWARYQAVVAVKPALRFMLLQTFAFTVMLLFIAHSAYIYQEHFDVGPSQFSLLFGANIVLMIVANFANRWFLHRMSPLAILRYSLSVQGVGVLLLLAVVLMSPNLWLFLPAMMITVGAMGAITSNTQACFMEYFPKNSGTAAALMGATQFAVGGVILGLSSLLPESLLSVVASQAVCSILCLWLIWSKQRSSL